MWWVAEAQTGPEGMGGGAGGLLTQTAQSLAQVCPPMDSPFPCELPRVGSPLCTPTPSTQHRGVPSPLNKVLDLQLGKENLEWPQQCPMSPLSSPLPSASPTPLLPRPLPLPPSLLLPPPLFCLHTVLSFPE